MLQIESLQLASAHRLSAQGPFAAPLPNKAVRRVSFGPVASAFDPKRVILAFEAEDFGWLSTALSRR
jgi:hypothetical protein